MLRFVHAAQPQIFVIRILLLYSTQYYIMKKLILASGSPRRKEFLDKAGLTFEIITSDYVEDMTLSLPPTELVKFLSHGKALPVAKDHPEATVLSADTIVVCNGAILGKPHTEENARKMLRHLSGTEHSVFTGFTVIHIEDNKSHLQAVETKILFKELSDEEIDEYIATGDPLDKAGAYAIQKVGDKFVEKIDGSFSNVVGLPIEEVLAVLRDQFGFENI